MLLRLLSLVFLKKKRKRKKRRDFKVKRDKGYERGREKAWKKGVGGSAALFLAGCF